MLQDKAYSHSPYSTIWTLLLAIVWDWGLLSSISACFESSFSGGGDGDCRNVLRRFSLHEAREMNGKEEILVTHLLTVIPVSRQSLGLL